MNNVGCSEEQFKFYLHFIAESKVSNLDVPFKTLWCHTKTHSFVFWRRQEKGKVEKVVCVNNGEMFK